MVCDTLASTGSLDGLITPPGCSSGRRARIYSRFARCLAHCLGWAIWIFLPLQLEYFNMFALHFCFTYAFNFCQGEHVTFVSLSGRLDAIVAVGHPDSDSKYFEVLSRPSVGQLQFFALHVFKSPPSISVGGICYICTGFLSFWWLRRLDAIVVSGHRSAVPDLKYFQAHPPILSFPTF